MKLTKTPAQGTDYNLKLTKDEVLAITKITLLGDESTEDWKIWCKMLELIEKEGKNLGNSPSE